MNDRKEKQRTYQRHDGRKKRKNKRRHCNKQWMILTVIVLVVSVTVVLIPLSGCSRHRELLGVWKYDQYTQYEFLKKGQGSLRVDDVCYEYKYSISKNKLKLDFVEGVVRDCEYIFTVEDNILTLTGGE